MAGDEADFTVRLVDQITSPGRNATITIKTIIKATEDLDNALHDIDQAMAHQNWVAFKRGQIEAQKLADETKKIEAEFKKLDDAMEHQNWVALKRGEAAMARVQKAGKVAGVSLDSVAAGVATGFAAAAAAVGVVALATVAATGVIGEAAIEAGQFAQTSTLAISQLTGGIGDAGKTFDEVRALAQTLGLQVEETQHAFQHFLAMQFTAEQSKDLIKLGADLQSIGASGEQVQSVFHQLATIKSFGKLQQQSLSNLAQAGVSEKLVIEALSKSLGKTPDEIQKALAAGTIKADEGIDAIKEAILHKTHESALGEAGAAFASTTLTGMKNKFTAGVDNVLIDIGKAILPELVSIGETATAIIGRISESGKLDQMKDGFILVFHSIARFVEDNMPMIEKVVTTGIDLIIFALRTTASVIDFVTGHWETISAVIKGTAIVLGVIGGILLAVGVLFLGTILAFPLAIAAIVGAVGFAIAKVIEFGKPVFDFLVTVETAIVGAIGAIISFISGGDAFGAAFQWASNLVTGLIQGIENFAGAALDKVRNFGQSVADAFKSALGIASPSKVFEEAGVFTVQGFIKGITANDNAITGATANMSASAFNGLGDAPAPAPASQAGGIGGGGHNFEINIAVGAGTDPAAAQQIGKAIGAEVRRELVSIFQDLQPTGTG